VFQTVPHPGRCSDEREGLKNDRQRKILLYHPIRIDSFVLIIFWLECDRSTSVRLTCYASGTETKRKTEFKNQIIDEKKIRPGILLFVLRSLVFDNSGDLFLQHRDLMHNNVPENLQVNAEISMNQGVAETGNGSPVC